MLPNKVGRAGVIGEQVLSLYPGQGDFLASLSPGYFDSGAGFGISNGLTTSKSFSGGTPTFSYTVTAPLGGVFSDGNTISSFQTTDPLIFTFDTSPNPVTAVGGIFGGVNEFGVFQPSTLTLDLSDGTTQTLVTTPESLTGFFGFIVPNDVSITTLTVTDTSVDFPAAAQLFVGVPETSTYAAAGFMGLCVGGLWLRRSRRTV